MNETAIKDHDEVIKAMESLDFESVLSDWLSKLPELEIFAIKRAISIKARILPDGEFRVIRVKLSDTLIQVMTKVSEEFQVTLLPPSPSEPYDQLFCYNRNDQLIGPLTELSTPIWKILIQYHCKRKFGLKLMTSFKVNATWKVAPKNEMTPREILDLFGMDYTQYTLYLPNSSDPLPLDESRTIVRGECFEAIKDGRYGAKNE